MLTAREIQVLQLLARGHSYANIARQLGISVHTVGTHIKNAYRRLSVSNAAAAVTRAAELGLLKPKLGGDRCDAVRDVRADVDSDGLPGRLQRRELAFE
jgi:DNA-binding CsgD family transcriptional regulator